MAGSPVVDTTTTGGRPATCGRCGVLVGGTGQNTHLSRAATGPRPASLYGAAASSRAAPSAIAAGSVIRCSSTQLIASKASSELP